MKRKIVLSTVLGVAMAFTSLLPAARADESNHLTQLTFDQAVEIPGQILPAGTYWFELVSDFSNRDVVRILSADQKTVYATEMTGSAERGEPANGTLLTFAERESSKPQALLTWFYPGETIGQEFEYFGREGTELSHEKHQTVTALPMSETQVRLGF